MKTFFHNALITISALLILISSNGVSLKTHWCLKEKKATSSCCKKNENDCDKIIVAATGINKAKCCVDLVKFFKLNVQIEQKNEKRNTALLLDSFFSSFISLNYVLFSKEKENHKPPSGYYNFCYNIDFTQLNI